MSRIQWKGMSQHARTVVIALVAFVIGCFVQAEFDRGAFPGGIFEDIAEAAQGRASLCR